MKSSTKISLSLAFFFILLFLSISLTARITSAPAPVEDFEVAFHEEPGLDHVCFYITLKNLQGSDDSFPLKPLLNRTSIDISKAETRLWEEEEYEYEVTHCNTCEVESCMENNVTKKTECINISVTDCGKCGTRPETKTGLRWGEKTLASTERVIVSQEKTGSKDYELNKLSNEFEAIQIKKSETKRYKLCYRFNEIPRHPVTGMPGSYGYMYLDVKDKLYYDFEHSSWWDYSWVYKQPINISVGSGTTRSNYQVEFVINSSNNGTHWNWSNECVDSNTTRARFVNGSDTSELDLWVESCSVTGQNMTVIVEVDQNITTNNYTIYLYYGNMDATAKTDGNATFEFFDDIEDNDVTDYGLTWGSDTLGTSTTSYHGTYAMYLPDGGGSEHDSKWRRNVSPIYLPVIVEYYVRTIAPDTILGVGAPTGEAWDNLPTVGDLGNGRSDGDNPEWNRMGDYPVRFSTTFDRDVWYPIKWLVNTTNVTVIYGSVDTRTDLIPEGGANITAIEIVQVEYGEGNGQFDDIRIRKYHDPEPTYTIGPEEARPPQITITSPENKTYNTNTLYLNVSTDKNASWCGYSLDNQENISMTKLNDTYFWYLNSSMTEGSHNVIFWCNDTSGDVWNSTTRYFSVDTIPPAITIYSPEDKRYDTIYIDLNWSTNESLETLDWTAYSLNGASNVSLYHMEWINTGENFDLVDGVALGITQNGTYLWFSNYDTAEIYRYWMNGSYADFSFNASESSGILEPGGITQDGTYFWITDRQIRSVYRYWMKNGTYADFSFDISEKVGEPYGITNDGAYLWIVDRTSDQVYKYWTNGSYADFDFDTDSYGNDLPIGITQDGTYFWVTDYEDYKVYKYWTNGSYANENIDVYTGVPAIYPGGITQDGTYFWIIFDTGGHVYKYYKNTQLVNETLTALQGYNNLTLCANDTAGNMNCVAVNFSYWIWEITFNIFSGETGENLTNVNVYCNNSWSVAGVDSGYSHNFLQGDYSCTFEKSTYFNKTVTFTADSDKMIDVKMSKIGALTVEEHQWIEWLYDCWFSGDCGQTLDRIETMVVYINQTTTQINETVNKVWNQFKRTDESVVLTEEPISTVVNSTSNITYNYSISVPEKEDYLFLPIRIFYWFLNEDNTSCYSQGNYSVAMIEPYCQPLVAHTIGEVNAVLNFTVELRPSLPAGNYTLVRRIDIDPNDIWINYGHDIIGTIEVLGDTNKAGVSLKAIGITAEVDKRIRTHEESVSEAGTDGITGLSIGEMLNPASLSMVISLVTLMVVIYLVVAKRKQ